MKNTNTKFQTLVIANGNKAMQLSTVIAERFTPEKVAVALAELTDLYTRNIEDHKDATRLGIKAVQNALGKQKEQINKIFGVPDGSRLALTRLTKRIYDEKFHLVIANGLDELTLGEFILIIKQSETPEAVTLTQTIADYAEANMPSPTDLENALKKLQQLQALQVAALATKKAA